MKINAKSTRQIRIASLIIIKLTFEQPQTTLHKPFEIIYFILLDLIIDHLGQFKIT